MKFKTYAKGLTACLAGALILLSGSTDTFANLPGRWIQHPAAALRSENKESQVDRIIEGNRYVYFSVRGALLNRSNGNLYSTNNTDPLQLFRFDKTKEFTDANIRPVAQEFDLSGVLPDVMGYDPRLGVFVLIYDNQSLDLIYDDGTFITSKALYNGSAGKKFQPYSITFDDRDPLAYIACAQGVVVLNLSNGEAERFFPTDKAISWAGRVSDSMVLFAGNIASPNRGGTYATNTYIYPVDNVPSRLTAPMEGLENLQNLMPLSDGKFAALAYGGADTKHIFRIFSISDNGQATAQEDIPLTTDNASSINFRHMFRTDGMVQPVSGGYSIQGQEAIVLLNSDGSVSRIDKKDAGLSAAEQASKAASVDGSRIWLYTYDVNGITSTDKRGFYSRSINEDGSFGSDAEIVIAAPIAPAGIYNLFGSWNPKYGLIVRGPGSVDELNEKDIDRLSGLKDGTWTDLSYAANNPKYLGATIAPNNAVTDPLNPDWIWGNSAMRVSVSGLGNVPPGLHRVDLGDYSNYLGIGSTTYSSYAPTYPGYFAVLKPTTSWPYPVMFSNVDFDNEGTMWFARYQFTWSSERPDGEDNQYDQIVNAQTPIYYLTAEERKQISNIGSDSSSLPDLAARKLIIPNIILLENAHLKALKAPLNSTYLVSSYNHFHGAARQAFIYDHNGTPENADDDRYAIIDVLYDEKGDEVLYEMQRAFYEDLKTGDIWLLTSSGPYVFNPSEYLDGNKTCRRLQISDGNGGFEHPFEFIYIKDVTDDEAHGRRWLATEEGMYCMEVQTNEILDHYTVDNSRLPSNNVSTIICSPEGAIYALTDRGIAEFWPEGSHAPLSSGDYLSIWPAKVAPDFKGYVSITGVVGGMEYIILDEEGREVKSLGNSTDGKLQWDLTDNEDRRVGSGRFNICRKGTDERNTVIVLDSRTSSYHAETTEE